jgi:predicted nucleotidyltransferase
MIFDQFNIEEARTTLVSRLKSLNPTRIILFGSYAYGNPSINSDLDICIIKKEVNSKFKEKKEIRSRLSDMLIAKDILILSEKEYEFYSKQYGSVYMDIENKGIVIWNNS